MRYLFLLIAIFFNLHALTVTCNTNKFVTQNVTPSTPTLNGKPYCSAMGGGLVWTNNPTTTPCIMVSYTVIPSTLTYTAGTTPPSCPAQPPVPGGVGGTACFIDYDSNPRKFICNPKPSDNVSASVRCDNTYVSTADNSIKQCNPNTNIANVIDNATSAKMVNGELEITCKVGYSIDYTPNISIGSSDTPFDSVRCIPSIVKDPDPVIVVDPSSGDVVTNNPDGSKIVKKIDGTIIKTDTKGITTTTYTNGSTSISGSFGAANGGSSTSSVIAGANTPSESGTIGATDYVPSLVSTSCSSSTLTLEQKTLCEINQGIKNQNSETSPQNSVNNILRDINVDNNAAYAAKHDILPDMEKIIQQSEYLSRTIDDFKNFIKDSEELKELNIKDILEKALLILHPAIVNSHIKIVKNISCDIKVDVNENELVQSFINIINNAKDAVNENVQESDDRYIFITMDKNIDNIKELSICDTGGGISQNVINRIFEPYFTTKHQSVGTGLGLSMTHKIIVEKYKFSLNVVNKEIEYNGKKYYGACFVMQFEDN